MSQEIAVVAAGFGNSHNYTDPFTNHLASVFENIEQFTLPELYKRPLEERFSPEDLERVTFIGYSGGAERMPPIAHRVITLCGVEPLHPAQAIIRAAYAARNLPYEHEREIALYESVKEIVRNPEHLLILGRIATFSTFTQLKCRALRYPGGRFYLAAEDDEFGFGDQYTINSALRNGIEAEYFGVGHTYPMKNPEKTATRIHELLEAHSTYDTYDQAS